MTRESLEDLEVNLLLEAVHGHYGYDFRQYVRASIKRRLWRRAWLEGVETISALQDRILHEPTCMDRLVVDLAVNVTSMFRDPGFYRAFRDKVIPMLRTYPFIRIWNAGCSSGEETYSLAIMLEEAGLYDRARIYATDINDNVLHRAREGLFPLDKMRDYTANYLQAGGVREFSSYYEADSTGARVRRSLGRNIVFAQHNLASDRSFNEFHAIVCRNVLIYFDRNLQDRVHDLFFDSLVTFGALALGEKESIRFTRHVAAYEELDPGQRLYRKVV
ncbi:MAG TPA: protein-glutamate O-methyltransferase CheR [Acidimicrobiales bacterium]|nr:protein-glutamate O-methyltransferase CheR [Acidimicrobiales bacterium]